MQEPPRLPTAIGKVEVQLLDPASGRPMKSWIFNDQNQVTIGRSPDQDIEISDPYVSRTHANLIYRDAQWYLISLGRHGVMVANQFITEQPIGSDVTFRLGVEGPTLRFRKAGEVVENMKTISFDALPTMILHVDQSKVQNEVGEIANGEYFQSLQQRAKNLRLQKKTD
jgi:pSer/pThr/pTyr-binding forkhead associated (FHA) protein